MQTLSVEQSTTSPGVTTHSKASKIIFGFGAIGTSALLLGLVFNSIFSWDDPDETVFDGYKSMRFFIRSPRASYLAPRCSEPVGRVKATAAAVGNFAGPFNLDMAELEMTGNALRVCSAESADLGELRVHHDPCDSFDGTARVGIPNVAQSCFLNSAVQLLLGMPAVCSAVFDERNVRDLNHSPLPVLRDFADAYRQSLRGDSTVPRGDAYKFKEQLQNLGIVKTMSDQEDPGEALLKLFDFYSFPDDLPFLSTLSNYVSFGRGDLIENDSGKDDDYTLATCSGEDCRTEGDVRRAALVPLSLPPLPQDYVPFDDLYELSFVREIPHAHDSPLRVRILPEPTRAITVFGNANDLAAADQVLFNVQLEGYDPDLDRVVKRSDQILVPQVWQGMNLIGVTVHLGEDNLGHYVSYKRRCFGSGLNEWMKYDDHRTSPMSTDQVMNSISSSKLLFFMKDPELPPCGSLAIV